MSDDESVSSAIGWRRGPTAVSFDGIVDHLYDVARHHAHRALGSRDTENGFDMLDGVAHAGSAVEFMAKAAIANVDPILLARGGTKGELLDAVSHLKGAKVAARHEKWRFASVDASVAVQMSSRIHRECFDHQVEALECLGVRNGAQHMGVVVPAAHIRAIDGMTAYIDAVVECIGRDPDKFWEDQTARVAEVLQGRGLRLEQSARLQVAAARSRYDVEASHLTPEALEQFVRRRMALQFFGADAHFDETCPACGHETARVYWTAEFEAEEGDDGELDFYGGMVFGGLKCPVCDLVLTAAEAEAFGIESTYPGDDSPDV